MLKMDYTLRINLKNKWDDVTKHILKSINRIVSEK